MYKVVVSPEHFMGLSGFSASHKPIKSVKGNSSLSSASLFWFPSLLHTFPPLRSFVLFFLLLFPISLTSSSRLLAILFLFFLSFSIDSVLHNPLPPPLCSSHFSSSLCFRFALSSLYYVVAVGESVCVIVIAAVRLYLVAPLLNYEMVYWYFVREHIFLKMSMSWFYPWSN